MRSEEKENFRLVSPMMMMMMAVMCAIFAEIIGGSCIDQSQMLPSGHCASNAQQWEVGETGKAATNRVGCGGSSRVLLNLDGTVIYMNDW